MQTDFSLCGLAIKPMNPSRRLDDLQDPWFYFRGLPTGCLSANEYKQVSFHRYEELFYNEYGEVSTNAREISLNRIIEIQRMFHNDA